VFTYGDTNNKAKQPDKVTLTPVGMTPTGAPIFTAVFVAEFNPVLAKCTGRFQQVIAGSFIMVAKSKPFSFVGAQSTPFEYFWQGNGWIQFAQGNRAMKR
jgi:hypothetical protein